MFPLRRLPYLAVVEVVKSMSPVDILLLNMASQKTSRVIKGISKPSIKLNFQDYGYNVQVNIEVTDQKLITLQFLPIEVDSPANWKVEGFNIQTYWVDKREGLKDIAELLMDAFTVESVSYNVLTRSPGETLRSMNHVINLPGVNLQKLEWFSYPTSNDEFQQFLTTVINAKQLILVVSRNERPVFDRFDEYSLDTLCVSGGHWLTLEYLCALKNCETTLIEDTVLTSEQFNTLLKYLLPSDGRFDSWKICSENILDVEVVLDGLDMEDLGDGVWTTRNAKGCQFLVEIKEKSFKLLRGRTMNN